MSKHPRWTAIAIGLLLLSGGLVACAQHATDLSELFQLTDVIGSDVPVARAMADERPPAAAVLLTPMPQTDEHCLDCHTDVESLRELATEAEPVEAPSSGEG